VAPDHKKLCIHALGEAEGKPITPHAHRVTLATGITAQPDGDEATAQALVRHKTVEALRTYYKMLPSKYADMVNRATRIDRQVGPHAAALNAHLSHVAKLSADAAGSGVASVAVALPSRFGLDDATKADQEVARVLTRGDSGLSRLRSVVGLVRSPRQRVALRRRGCSFRRRAGRSGAPPVGLPKYARRASLSSSFA